MHAFMAQRIMQIRLPVHVSFSLSVVWSRRCRCVLKNAFDREYNTNMML